MRDILKLLGFSKNYGIYSAIRNGYVKVSVFDATPLDYKSEFYLLGRKLHFGQGFNQNDFKVHTFINYFSNLEDAVNCAKFIAEETKSFSSEYEKTENEDLIPRIDAEHRRLSIEFYMKLKDC